MLSLTGLFQVCVLFLNAFAILNEDRFLRRIGWGFPPEVGNGPDSAYVAFKGKAVQFLHAVRLLARIPLIFVNTLIVLFLLVLG